MRKFYAKEAITVACLIAALFCYDLVQAETLCNGPYKGRTFTQSQINQLLNANNRAANSSGKIAPLNLCGTNLSHLNLANTKLQNINLNGADLSYSNFSASKLDNAKLEKAYFRWANLKQADLRDSIAVGAVFKNANLDAINLQQANLQQADISNAKLRNSILRGTDLSKANLANSDFSNSFLSWAKLYQATADAANFSNVDFENAQLQQADFSSGNLSRAYLLASNLQQAKLLNTNVKDANFSKANMLNTIYQVKLNHLPNIIAMATVKNFREIAFDYPLGAPSFVELRNAFRSNGLRNLERIATSMLKTKQMHSYWQAGGWGYLEAAFSYVLFYLPSDFGAAPGRCLLIFLWLILLCAFPYTYAIKRASKKHGILVSWPAGRFWHMHMRQLDPKPPHLTTQLTARPYPLHPRSKSLMQIMQIALYFSLLSAFQIGWQEFNLSNWLTRMQKRDYKLSAKGWVRRLAGAQSIISIYLVLLWALTYFGRPFEW